MATAEKEGEEEEEEEERASCPSRPRLRPNITPRPPVSRPRGIRPHQLGGLHLATPDSKYETYACRVDMDQGDRSVDIALFSWARPHMRAFHFSWGGFFIAFCAWFAIAPLLSEIQVSLDITKAQIWTSSIFAVAGTIPARILNGPLCDKYGARWVMGATLILVGIPTMATGLVSSSTGLSILRFVIGIGGSAFVTCQYWTSSMFTPEVAGTALALVGGWGNLGGGVSMVVVGSVLFPLFKLLYGEIDTGESKAASVAAVMGEEDTFAAVTATTTPADRAWRTVCIIPGLMAIVYGFIVVRYSDDCPKGNYRKRKRLGIMPSVSAWESMKAAAAERDTWLLFIQYACCFGVELTITNGAALYFKEEFGLNTESAAAIASVFGWVNIFARGMGGFVSDIANANCGMRGRLVVQSIVILLEGLTIIAFGYAQTLAGSIATLTVASVFVQSSEGSTFAIVPYIRPYVTGSISGIIGAGGTLGGVIFSLLFRQMDYRHAFIIMGCAVMASSVLTIFVYVRGHAGMFYGRDHPNVEERRIARRAPLTQGAGAPGAGVQEEPPSASVPGTMDLSLLSALDPKVEADVHVNVDELADAREPAAEVTQK